MMVFAFNGSKIKENQLVVKIKGDCIHQSIPGKPATGRKQIYAKHAKTQEENAVTLIAVSKTKPTPTVRSIRRI